METRKPYKILLIGDHDAKQKFIAAAVDNKLFKIDESSIGIDFVSAFTDNKKFNLWDMAGQGHFSTILSTYFRGVDAVIYLDADADLIKRTESMRDKNTSIAINYNTFDLTARECLDKIDFLKKSEPYVKMLEKNTLNKPSLIVCAHRFDDKSIFKVMPTDMVAEFALGNYYIAQKDLCYKQDIYYKCPAETKALKAFHQKIDAAEIANKSKADDNSPDANPSNSWCHMQ